jgi:hypothetical protein
METSQHVAPITPPSGALARAPEPEDQTMISDSQPLPTPAPGGLELVNFRDPSQMTSEMKSAEIPAAAAAASAGPGRGVWIGAGAAALVVIALAAVFVVRGRSHVESAPPRPAPPPAATAPIVFPAPQVGKDAAREAQAKSAQAAAASRSAVKTSEEAAAGKPEPAKARSFKVQFSSIPSATLLVDGKRVGPSIPAQVVPLTEGKHTVRFEGPDLPPYEKQFTVGSDGAPPIAYRFPIAYLVIRAPSWAGANVLIDSKFKGVLIGEKSFQIPSGSHKLTLSREGVAPYTTDVTVSEGEKKTVTPPEPTANKEGA